ncbi:hypothetical protein DFQ28_000363 [Apophysomyces sp. BC1034]|nr:hypothetical protein DFQ30_004445 [Apophysomyces sp. BC1015]KAG0179195.1 hypothetical protein DFQ29_002418 [Apophysomyces sp. BC1021]KAG0191350.1 hypothetical protein DFQ28_000363 [Apophysomyces sp. BC1034]
MPSLCCKQKNHSSSEFFSVNATNHYAPHTVIEPVHIDIRLGFHDLDRKIAESKVTLTFKHSGRAHVRSKEERSTITLNAEEFEDVAVFGEGVTHTYDGHHIKLFWDTPFEVDAKRDVVIEYMLDDPVAGLYFQKEDSIPGVTTHWAITDNEPEKARHWLPTVDFPTIRTTLTWAITAPKHYTSLANGTLVSQEEKEGYVTTYWELTHPCPSYLACFAVGDFVVVDDGEVEGKPVKYFTAKGHQAADLRRAFDKTPSMMRWLQKKVNVPFPWTKYYQIALPAIRGAMENISLVTWSDAFILDEVNALERQYLTDLVNVHEMAHTYFGDLLVIRYFEHAWLKESWATYMEACWLEDNMSEDDFRYEMLSNANGYIRECSKYMRPIVTRKYDSSWDMFDMHTYPGGAWRIHMLRKLLDEDAFWKAVELYVAQYATKTVTTTDFQGALEKVSGLNLTRFFDEWLLSKGFPKIKGDYEYDKVENRIKIVLSQTQVDEANDVPLFEFDLELELTDDQGKTYVSSVHFDCESSITTYIHLKGGASPSILRVDPDGRVLFTLDMAPDQDVLVNTAKSAKDVVNRIRAYQQLIKGGSRSALKAVQNMIVQEPFYGVRIEAAAALAKLQSTFSLQILTEILDNEKNPLALASILTSCRIRDTNVRAAILRFLQRPGTLPYRAHAAALVALAVQRQAKDLQYLLEVAQDERKIGQHAIVRGGALKALGYHRSEEAFNYLIKRVGYKIEPVQARPHALSGLRYSCEWQEERLKKRASEVFNILVNVSMTAELVNDPNPSVRTEAVESVVALQLKSEHDRIESTRSMYSKDDQSWLDRKLAELRKGSAGAAEQATNEHIEKLEERVRKLEEKLAAQEALKDSSQA